MALVETTRARDRRVFASVFPVVVHSTPTPEVSPYIGTCVSPTIGTDTAGESTSVADAITQQSLAWSNVTRWLSLAGLDLDTPDRHIPDGVDDALLLLFRASVYADGDKAKDLLDWYAAEIRQVYEDSLKPRLLHLWQQDIPGSEARRLMERTVALLDGFQSVIVRPFDTYISARKAALRTQNPSMPDLTEFITDFRLATLARIQHSVTRSLPGERVLSVLTLALHNILCSASDISPDVTGTQDMEDQEFLASLPRVGLGQELGQKALAYAVKAVIRSYVLGFQMKVDWVGQGSVVDDLRLWVQDRLEPAILTCLRQLTANPSLVLEPSERAQWQHMALSSLGRLRAKYLLKYVQTWPQSLGAISDLKEYLRAPEAKNHVANTFCRQMSQSILHAGVNTSELLSIYTAVILVFKALDARGVLLEKVAHPLRSYLRDREDTVKVIAASFLADVADSTGGRPTTTTGDDVCADLAIEVMRAEQDSAHAIANALDWDDMAWTPDPMDAGPDYRKSKGEDIISHMLTLFEQESFIKEVQSILGERLLRAEESDLEQEIRLVELFKARLGQDKLQTCEVMLRDMQDSARIMKSIRSTEMGLPTVLEVYEAIPEDGISLLELNRQFRHQVPNNATAHGNFVDVVRNAAVRDSTTGLLRRNVSLDLTTSTTQAPPTFFAQVLSSFFWPALRDDEFAIPAPIATLQATYEQEFERIKNLRKLQWLSALGRATVELELEDRTVMFEDVHTWQASVIYAFQDAGQDVMSDGPVSKTVEQLAEALQMDDLLVRNAITFWIGHRVLYETASETYAVLETLPSGEDPTAPAVPEPTATQADAVTAVKSQNTVLQDNKDMYQMFIMGMLTNGGAMDTGRIGMMMKMVIPGGFAFGTEEVQWLLTDLAKQGKIVDTGGVFAVR